MAKKTSLIREFMRATKISRRRKSESEQAYLNRIVLEVGGLSEKVRANLSPEGQAWYRAAVEAINQGEMIPSLAARDDVSDAGEGEQKHPESEDSAEHPQGKAATPSADIQHEAGKATKPPSASDRTRRIILENLGRVEKKNLRELVANAGIAVTNSSFDTIYYETNKTMQIAREMGLVK
jgi:hypothetical protein